MESIRGGSRGIRLMRGEMEVRSANRAAWFGESTTNTTNTIGFRLVLPQ